MSKETKVVADISPVDQELTNKVSAMRAIVTAHSLLHTGGFKVSDHQAVMQSSQFLVTLHEQLKKQAIEHPDAAKVPELKELMAQESKAANV